MPLTLHDAFVPTCLQVLGALSGMLDKAEAHCASQGLDAEDLIGAQLAPDMKDFAYQVKSCLVHSAIAIESCVAGSFSPDASEPPRSFDGLRALVQDASARLGKLSAADMEALIGKTVRFTIPGVVDWSFTGDQFLLSFSQPNFYFHATTAYDLLRSKGVPLGKMDFLGAMRMAG
jgi:hypothetical protein